MGFYVHMQETALLVELNYQDDETGYVLYKVPIGKEDAAEAAVLAGYRAYRGADGRDMRTIEDFIEAELQKAGIPAECLGYNVVSLGMQ